MPYFDHNATTPLSPVAREAWLRAADEAWQNPSSAHRAGARVRVRLDAARKQLAEMLDTEAPRLVWTGGATEAAHALFAHLARTQGAATELLLNPTEHPCVLEAARQHFGESRLRWLPVTRDGVVEVAAVTTALRPGASRCAAVVVMAAHNETGVLQPWAELAQVCRAVGVPYVCDASQWLGKLPGGGFGAVDWLFGAAHKFGGPKGVGFLQRPAAETGFCIRPGGGQEQGQRGGTEDYPGIAAMVAALADAEQTKVLHESDRLYRRNHFERDVQLRLPGTTVVAASAERLWNTSLLLLPHGENHRWLALLDKRGFAVATGSACASGKAGPSPTLAALGYGAEEARRALRVSAGWETTQAEWEALAEALVQVAAEARPADGVVSA